MCAAERWREIGCGSVCRWCGGVVVRRVAGWQRGGPNAAHAPPAEERDAPPGREARGCRPAPQRKNRRGMVMRRSPRGMASPPVNRRPSQTNEGANRLTSVRHRVAQRNRIMVEGQVGRRQFHRPAHHLPSAVSHSPRVAARCAGAV